MLILSLDADCFWGVESSNFDTVTVLFNPYNLFNAFNCYNYCVFKCIN